MIRLGYVILYVEDVPRALAFYHEALGLGIRMNMGMYAELETGGTALAVSQRAFVAEHLGLPLPPPGQGSSEIGLVVPQEQVDEMYARALAAGATAVMAPTQQPWGQRVSYVRDPDGHLVEICGPVTPD